MKENRLYSIEQDVIDKFEHKVVSGQRSRVIEKLIIGYLKGEDKE